MQHEVSQSAAAGVRPYPKPAYAWSVVGIFFLAAVLSYTDRLILNLLVDPIRRDLGLTDTGVSLLQGAAFAILYAVLGLPLGRYADRHNRRNLALAGVAVWSVGTACCGFAHSFAQLFGARIAVGMGEAALAPAVISMLPDYFPPERRATAIGIFLAGMISGAGVASLASGFLLSAIEHGLLSCVPVVSALAPWRAVLVVLAVPGIVMIALLTLVREPERRERSADLKHDAGLASTLAYLKRNAGTFAVVLGAFGLIQVVDYGLNAWLPTLLFRRFHLTAANVGASIGAISIAGGLLGALVGGITADMLQSRGFTDAKMRVAAIAATALLPCLCFPLLPAAHTVLAVFAGYTFVFGVLAAVGLSAIQDVAPSEMRGLLVSLQAFIYTLLGLGCGPTLVALVGDHVLRGPLHIGDAMAAVALPVAVAGVTLLWRALPAYKKTRATLGDAGAETAQPPACRPVADDSGVATI